MCLKLSIANKGKSAADLPKWFNGWENLRPSAWTDVMVSIKHLKLNLDRLI